MGGGGVGKPPEENNGKCIRGAGEELGSERYRKKLTQHCNILCNQKG